MSKREDYKTFEHWMRAVDNVLSSIAGLVSEDLPDYCYADAYEDGYSPAATAKRALRAAHE